MSIARHVIQIIHNEEKGPVDFEFLTSKIEQVLVKHNDVRAFISLCQCIEDRSDPRSKYHDKTIDLILEQFGVARATYYKKLKKYKEFGLDGIIPRKPGPKKSRLPSQILSRIFELRKRELSSVPLLL